MSKEYELIYIVAPELDQEALQKTNDETSQQIQTAGGTVDNIRTSDVRQLAYEVGEYTEGVYVVVNLHGETSAMTELDRALTLNQGIMRHMIIRIDD